MDAQSSLTPGSFRQLFSAAPDAMVVVDEDGHIVAANDRAADLFRYPLDELLKLNVEDLVPHDHRSRHAEHREAFTRAPTVRTMNTRPGGLLALRNGAEPFPVSISLGPTESHGATYTIATIRDMTVERAAQRALVAAKNRAESMTRELETFSYTVAHDLRAPLRAIDAYARAIEESHDPALSPDNAAALARILSNAERMGELIEDLLALFRIVRGELRISEVDLSGIATEVTDELQAAAPDRDVQTIVEPGLTALADPRLVRIAIANLLENAWKFTTPIEHARIEVGRTEGAPDRFFVRDNGVGFSMAHANRLFRPFQRLHKASEFPGTGIGLATVEKVVARHEGRAWAESALGEGTTIWFTLAPEP